MNTKTKMIFSAALAATWIALPCAQAATSGATATNAPAAATATNSKPADVMAALFGDPVVAKGSGFEIKQSQLDAVVDGFKARAASQGQTVPTEDLTKSALNSLIVNQILLQKATDADKATGKKEADQTTATAVMIRELNAAPPETEIQKFYDSNTNASALPEQVHVRHILLLTMDTATRAPLPDDQAKAKKKQIEDILKRARAGEDFAALAKQYSEDPGSKDNSGELPPFARASADPSHAMVPEFEAAAFSLTNNQISDVVTTEYGYHIIKLLEKTPARKLALTDKLPSSEVTLTDQIKDFLTGQKLREQAPAYIEKLSKSPGVEILDPALKALMSASTNAPAGPLAK